MQPLQHLWRALESTPGLKAVDAEWRYLLSTEYTLLKPFLVVTSELATSYPALSVGEPRPIVAHARNDFAAISPAGGGPTPLRRSDVLVHRFDAGRLAREIGVALDMSGSVAAVAGLEFAWRIGTLPLQLGARPAFLTIPSDPISLIATVDGIAAQSRQSYLLLAPTRRMVDARAESRLNATDGAFFSICDLLHLDDEGQFRVSSSASHGLSVMIGVQSEGGQIGSVFQRQNDIWRLAFDGETAQLKDSVGMGYIARLLLEPNRDIPAVTLLAARAGIDPRLASGSAVEVLDNVGLERLKTAYRELLQEIEEAESNNDLHRAEKLRSELDSLSTELARVIGLGGRVRKVTDADRVRKAVSMAVTRATTRIKKEHAVLGRHLETSISMGLTFRYAPEREITWLT